MYNNVVCIASVKFFFVSGDIVKFGFSLIRRPPSPRARLYYLKPAVMLHSTGACTCALHPLMIKTVDRIGHSRADTGVACCASRHALRLTRQPHSAPILRPVSRGGLLERRAPAFHQPSS